MHPRHRGSDVPPKRLGAFSLCLTRIGELRYNGIMDTRHPAAEAFARKMPLPLAVCAVSRALYGTTVIVLDTRTARLALTAVGHTGPAFAAAMAVLDARLATVLRKAGEN